jgi:TetR/AcrR family transcriptional regulator
MEKCKPVPAGARSILSAATELFARDGYESVSISAIAEQAGVCKANIFHHYASKEVLYLEVMRKASAEHAEIAEALLKEDCTCVEKLKRLTTFDINTMLENELRTRLILRELGEPCENTVRRLAHQVFRRNFQLVIELFEQGKASGEFRADFNPVAAAVAWCGAKNSFFLCRESMQDLDLFKGASAPQAFSDEICRLLTEGILPAPSRSVAAIKKKTLPAPARSARKQKS